MIRLTLLSTAALFVLVGALSFGTDLTAPRDEAAPPAAEVTRARTEPLRPEPAAARLPEPAPAPAAEPAPAPEDDMAAMTAGILADLNGAAPAPAPAPSGDMDALTESVLASLGAARATPAEAGGGAPADLSGLVGQALAQGESDAYIDALLNEAAAEGRIVVPGALRTADGRVDTRTLLASLVSRAAEADVAADVAALEAEARDGAAPARPAPQPAPQATARPGDRPEVYVVQPGDSLAGVAFRFYGETMAYLDIYAANADRLSSPDVIRVGQRLRLP